MMPIDMFINQLIQLGLADSFLDVINNHYLKVTEVYNLLSVIETNNIKDIECYVGEDVDSITVIVHLYNPVEDIIVGNNNDLTVQINNAENAVEITVTNNYESEEELYETRFNGRKQSYTPKWS